MTRFSKVKGVKFPDMENNSAVCVVGSGTYCFQSIFRETIK